MAMGTSERDGSSYDEARLAEEALAAAQVARMESAVAASPALQGMSDEVLEYVREESESDGYEYVSVGEWGRRVVDGIADFVSEHFLFFAIVAFIALASLVIAFGRVHSMVLLFLAFIFLSLLAAILLYLRWQEWRDKREELARAEMLYKAAQDAKRKQADERRAKASGKATDGKD